ncbi:hypothetical protein SAMN04489761_0079 [Tenacibaculum sp. MAR_2009_124]|uniref:hypothetical protein n=1 Tax=Tenacibaculum sp. MAR_2009_124 TaxID=1250059 RepID=UPI0008968233|nr:hypothetical protein [Tenacibaculum sp. MAR_2009_124]SEB35647.1 hypothetical protein SAMN04489761_0079 [Tenacibaculum sp. MAR_2009_124]
MFNFQDATAPSLAAEKMAKKYKTKGYVMDFSLRSLEYEIDKIIYAIEHYQGIESEEILKAECSAYFGVTLCRVYDMNCIGQYFDGTTRTGVNYYSYIIEKNGYQFHPAGIFEYRIPGYYQNYGLFYRYLHFRHYERGNRRFVQPGILATLASL